MDLLFRIDRLQFELGVKDVRLTDLGVEIRETERSHYSYVLNFFVRHVYNLVSDAVNV